MSEGKDAGTHRNNIRISSSKIETTRVVGHHTHDHSLWFASLVRQRPGLGIALWLLTSTTAVVKKGMRLLTHNLLICPVHKKPLTICHVTSVDIIPVEYQPQFIVRMVPRLDWSLLREAAVAVEADCMAALSESPPSPQQLAALELAVKQNDRPPLLDALQRLLLETHVVTGRLLCDQGEYYEIDEGIPNLLAEAAVCPADQETRQTDQVQTDTNTIHSHDNRTE
jgi:multifunctional methyltransferase subunit TRM112